MEERLGLILSRIIMFIHGNWACLSPCVQMAKMPTEDEMWPLIESWNDFGHLHGKVGIVVFSAENYHS